MINPRITAITTTTADCLAIDSLSGHEIFLNSTFNPLKKLVRAGFSLEFAIITSHSPQIAAAINNTLFGLFMRRMCSAESTVFFDFHSVGMSFLVLGGIVVPLFAFCTC